MANDNDDMFDNLDGTPASGDDETFDLDDEVIDDEDDDGDTAAEGAEEEDGEGEADGEDGEGAGETVADAADDGGVPLDPDVAELPYGKQVRRRIQEEINRRRQIEADYAAEREQLTGREQQLRDQLKRYGTGIADLGKKNLEFEIADAQRKLLQARDEDDSEAAMKAEAELMDLRVKKARFDDLMVQMQADFDAPPAKDESKPGPKANPLTQAWIGRNSWYNKPGFENKTQYAQFIDAQLAGTGMNATTPEYFAELDRRINAAFPPPSTQPGVRKPAQKPGAKGSPVTKVDRTAQISKKDAVRITAEDLKLMRTFGLDPKNKAHLAEFRNQRRETQKSGR